MATTLSRQIGNQTMTFETGRLAKQAHGSCTVQLGETQVMVKGALVWNPPVS